MVLHEIGFTVSWYRSRLPGKGITRNTAVSGTGVFHTRDVCLYAACRFCVQTYLLATASSSFRSVGILFLLCPLSETELAAAYILTHARSPPPRALPPSDFDCSSGQDSSSSSRRPGEARGREDSLFTPQELARIKKQFEQSLEGGEEE